MSKSYTFDAGLRIWCRSDQTSISYSDGDDAENNLLNTVRNAQDVSSTSPELAAAIRDWPSEYHLSPARHNLLRFLDIGAHRNVLELGCGCGGMTRFLGEAGAIVVAIEGSKRRAEIAAARCRGLSNVSIYCDNLADFQSGDKFDFVTLIGVLEYAPKFIDADDPIAACLAYARSFLKEGGALVLAIENQLGLKYFNGCAEDHAGIPCYGINDLYGEADAITFGRHVLSQQLSKAGFPGQEFYFPFPDYKLPGLILSQAALRDDQLNVADLLIHQSGQCHPENHHRAFAENLAWRAVTRNGLLSELSNSFLVVARADAEAPQSSGWLAKMYNRSNRRPCYQLETTILRDEAMTLTVQKRRLFPAAPAPQNEWLKHVAADCTYHSGSLMLGTIHRAMAREAGIDELAACFAPWLKYLTAHSRAGADGAAHLPGNFVDCIPANLVQSPNGELIYIDAEWEAGETIPLAWIVTRGVVNSLGGCLENGALVGLTYAQCIQRIAGQCGMVLRPDDLDAAAELESRLVENCFSVAPACKDILSQPVFGYYRLSNNTPELRPELEWLRYELSRVKGTVSWRITAPLRATWNLLRKAVGKNRKV
ncbi:MAG TPA: class I SAM-dependent methyltransferase [Thauera sp.]|nr:class I SAM-dependent methyltransferase [Thauera sp.]